MGELLPSQMSSPLRSSETWPPSISSRSSSPSLTPPARPSALLRKPMSTLTDGLYSPGSPFPTYKGFGKTYEPGQGNNAYIFPGASLGVICTGIHHNSDSVFLSAAEGLADMVQDSDLAVGRLYPPLSALREISVKIATKVAIEAYKSGSASTYPEPEDKEKFIRQQLYDYTYDNALPV